MIRPKDSQTPCRHSNLRRPALRNANGTKLPMIPESPSISHPALRNANGTNRECFSVTSTLHYVKVLKILLRRGRIRPVRRLQVHIHMIHHRIIAAVYHQRIGTDDHLNLH